MKTKLNLIVAALAVAFTVSTHAQLVLAPNPPPHAQAAIAELVLNTVATAAVPLASGKVIGDLQSLSLYGHNLSRRYAASGGVTESDQVVLTDAQLAATVAALPALPTGETADHVRGLSANRGPKAIFLLVQFSS